MDDSQVFRTLVQHSYDIITVIALDGTRQYISPSVETLLGYTQEELTSQPGLALIHPDDRQFVRQAMNEVVAHPKAHPRIRVRICRKDGVWRLFEAVATNGLAQPGIDGVIFNSRDITEQVETERALERSHKKFQASCEASLDAVIFMDAEGLIQGFNQAAEEIFHYHKSDVLGKPLGESIIPPELREAHRAGLARFLKTREGPILNQRLQVQAMRADGQLFPVELTVVPIELEREAMFFVSFIRDISHQVALQEAVVESTERFRRTIENSSDIVTVLDRDNRRKFVSPAVEHILGFEPDGLVGGSALLLTHPDDRAKGQRFFERLHAQPGGRETVEVRLQHADGSWRWFEIIGVNRLDDPLINGIVATGRDITERRLLEEERVELLRSRQEYAKKLEHLASIRADFTAMIAHELTVPIATIRRAAELLASSVDSPLLQHIAAIMDTEAEHLRSLVEDVREIGQIESDRFSVALQRVKVDELLAGSKEVVDALDHRHAFQWPGPTRLCVVADRTRIEQVLRNLLSNAVRHTSEGTSVTIAARPVDDRIRIEVRDTGPGMSPSDLEIIFKKFGRSRVSQQRQVAGAGLGLYISQQIVRAHGSELRVESTPDQGTTFWFDLQRAND
jgi:PAS domain S-box-containing protein